MAVKKILFVEDSKVIQQTFRLFLIKNGYEVSIANNGMHGLSLFENEDFDLVITDLIMPIMDGFELSMLLKSNFNIPVIVLTGSNDPKTVTEIINIGVDDFIVKGETQSMKKLLDKIKKNLKEKK
jgi:DNA-binding response OmpR family regulator